MNEEALTQEQPVAPPGPTPTPSAPVQSNPDVEAATKEFGIGGVKPPPANPDDPAVPPSITPSPSPTPKPKDPTDDTTKVLSEHLAEGQGTADAQSAMNEFGLGSGGAGASTDIPSPTVAPAPAPGEPPPTKKPDSRSTGAKIIMDTVVGLSELPHETVAGILDGFNGAVKLANSIDKTLTKYLPNLPGVAGAVLKASTDLSQAGVDAHLDEVIGPAKSTTGALVRDSAHFLSSFLLTGAAGKAAGVTMGAGAVETAVKMAVSDFTFYEGKTENLANIAEKFPWLNTHLTDIFATHPDDPELFNRFKNAAIGLGVGAASEKLMLGLFKGIQFIRKAGGQSWMGRAIGEWTDGLKAESQTKIQPFEVAHLGDPEGPLLKAKAATAATEGIKPGEAIGQGPGYDINFAPIQTQDDVKQAMGMMAARDTEGIGEAGANAQPWTSTNAKADKLDAFNLLATRRQGQAFNASELRAGQRLYVTSAEKLEEVARIAQSSPTPANLYMFERMAGVHTLVAREIEGAKSEAGRALNILRQPVGSSADMAGTISEALDRMGGSSNSIDKVSKLVKLFDNGSQDGVDKFVKGTLFNKAAGAVQQMYIDGRFSQKTLVKKLTSDFANMGAQIADRRTAEYLTQKLGIENGVAVGESAAMAEGWVAANKRFILHMQDHLGEAFSEGSVSKALGSVRASVKQVGGMPIELPPIGRITAENFNIPNGSFLGSAVNGYGAYRSMFGNGISLADQFAKMVGYQMELHAQALRQTVKEMGSESVHSSGFKDRMSELITNPTDEIHLAAVDQATYQTFTGEPAELLNKLGNTVQSIPIFGRMLMPFKNTPINLLTQAAEHSLLAPIVASWRADVAAGGARQAVAYARMANGTVAFQLMFDAAMQGQLTGKGPEQAAERGNWSRLGNQAYSFKTPGGRWMSYNALEPFGSDMAVAADIAEIAKRADETVDAKKFAHLISGATFGIMDNIASKTYLGNLFGFVKAFGSFAEAQKFTKDQVGGIPATLFGSLPTQTAEGFTNRHARVAESLVDAAWRKVPGLSSTLPLQRNLWGDTLNRSEDLSGDAYNAFVPFWLTTPHPQAIDKEMERLKIFPNRPKAEIRDNGKTTPMDGHQADRFQYLAGNAIKDPVRGNMGLRDYLNATVEGKGPGAAMYRMATLSDERGDTTDARKTLIEKAISHYADLARNKMIHENGDLAAAIDESHVGGKIHMSPVRQRRVSLGREQPSSGSSLKGD